MEPEKTGSIFALVLCRKEKRYVIIKTSIVRKVREGL